jgi:hypothetical protein
MYICVTEVDYKTGIACTVEPQRTGPSMPAVKGLSIQWADQSTWPVSLASDGTYLRAPKYYGTCDDDADTTIAGVLEVLTENEWLQRKDAELIARKPFASWTLVNDQWVPPVQMPTDDKYYRWDEPSLSWVEVPATQE